MFVFTTIIYLCCLLPSIFFLQGADVTKGGPNSAVELLEEMGFQCGREVGRCCFWERW